MSRSTINLWGFLTNCSVKLVFNVDRAVADIAHSRRGRKKPNFITFNIDLIRYYQITIVMKPEVVRVIISK